MQFVLPRQRRAFHWRLMGQDGSNVAVSPHRLRLSRRCPPRGYGLARQHRLDRRHRGLTKPAGGGVRRLEA